MKIFHSFFLKKISMNFAIVAKHLETIADSLKSISQHLAAAQPVAEQSAAAVAAAVTEKKRKRKEKRDPNKPKLPLSAVILSLILFFNLYNLSNLFNLYDFLADPSTFVLCRMQELFLKNKTLEFN